MGKAYIIYLLSLIKLRLKKQLCKDYKCLIATFSINFSPTLLPYPEGEGGKPCRS